MAPLNRFERNTLPIPLDVPPEIHAPSIVAARARVRRASTETRSAIKFIQIRDNYDPFAAGDRSITFKTFALSNTKYSGNSHRNSCANIKSSFFASFFSPFLDLGMWKVESFAGAHLIVSLDGKMGNLRMLVLTVTATVVMDGKWLCTVVQRSKREEREREGRGERFMSAWYGFRQHLVQSVSLVRVRRAKYHRSDSK